MIPVPTIKAMIMTVVTEFLLCIKYCVMHLMDSITHSGYYYNPFLLTEKLRYSLSFKPTFSLSTFTFIKRLFSSSSLSALRVVSSAYLRLLIFLPAILIPAHSSVLAWRIPGTWEPGGLPSLGSHRVGHN